MARIVVFDSGLGSLSIIKPIRQILKAEIIYFADQANYPYGNKSKLQLNNIIKKTIQSLDRFEPDIIVMASNTPSLMLQISSPRIIDVKPPLQLAAKLSASKHIGILGTKSAVRSRGLTDFIKNNNISKSIKITKINGSDLVDLVESGKFITNEKQSKKIIQNTLSKILLVKPIDVITLSSTHLPFLKSLLQECFPHIQFIDPGEIIAQRVYKKSKTNQSKKNSLKIFTSGNVKIFEENLRKIGIKNKVFSFST